MKSVPVATAAPATTFNGPLSKDRQQDCSLPGSSPHRSPSWVGAGLLFVIAFVVLFLGMSRRPNIFDEGIVLTAAMRVAAGQLPHRDFYSIYGPAEYYVLAGLFKLFGFSVFAERLLDLFLESLTVSTVFMLASRCCHRWLAYVTAAVCMLWILGIGLTEGYATIPVCLLGLLSSACLLTLFPWRAPTTQLYAAGALAGLSALYRYDTGVALLVLQLCVICIAAYSRPLLASRLVCFTKAMARYLVGFAVVTLPPVLYYVMHAPLRPFLNDIFVYQSRYYHRERNLPFPSIHTPGVHFEQFGVYLPIAAAVLALCFLFRTAPGSRTDPAGTPNSTASRNDMLRGMLITFGMLAVAMYFKGVVRVALIGMYLYLVPSLLLTAILYEYRAQLPRFLRLCIYLVASLTVIFASVACARRAHEQLTQRSVIGRVLRTTVFRHRPSPGIQATWCKEDNPLTRGFCFLPDDGRIEAIEFIETHTTPQQTIYVGLTHHDRTFANDNLIYFATQRLPATPLVRVRSRPAEQCSYPAGHRSAISLSRRHRTSCLTLSSIRCGNRTTVPSAPA